MHLKDLLQQPDVRTRNTELKRAFNALSDVVCIDGSEVQAIHILVNLTVKLTAELDVTSQAEARRLLRSEEWLSKCVATIRFRHTHNLKYPDYKNRGVLRLESLGTLPTGYISSQLCKDRTRLGWAHNSADINYQIFFCAVFNWRGSDCCIADLICQKNTIFRDMLLEAGMYKKDFLMVSKELQKIAPKQTMLELGPELRQIRLPYRNAYCALTPVPSHVLQREIHLALKIERIHRCVIAHTRAASVGDLAASAAGKVFTFRTVPQKLRIWHTAKPKYELPDSELFALVQLTKTEQMLLAANNRRRLVEDWKRDALNYIDTWKKAYNIQGGLAVSTIVERFNAHLSKTKLGSKLAYNPDVTKLLNLLIDDALPRSENSTEFSEHQYLLLPSIRVSGASALSSAYTVGVPSLMGIWGFLHAFERKVQRLANCKAFQIESFAVCLHEFVLDNRGLTRETNLDGKKLVVPAVLPTRYCDLVVSFVLKIHESQQQLAPEQLISCLPNSLCQGAVHIKVDGLQHILWRDSFYKTAQNIPGKRGRWLVPDLSFIPSDMQSLAAEPNLLLSTVGYQLLETPTEKTGAVDELPHAFAEPVLGSVRQSYASADAVDSEFFWKLAVLPNAFLLGTEGTEHEAAPTI
ncbi:type I-F CRISPR-associated protein Csy2 [Rheinheimera texasensis]|uniref:type I-F CRISPR-associated protein Csy2 n=1 Tax=Rheinheimera texasensis TaxID=306205 RepID=UPI0032B1A13E